MNWTTLVTFFFLLGNEVSGSTNTGAVAISPSTSAPVTTSETSSSSSGGGNPVTQLFGYVKDSVLRLKDGSVEMVTNHKRCNTIRSKQKEYLAQIQSNMSEDQIKKMGRRITPTTGGISYEEFDFLQKGKEDRSKLGNIAFMMFAAPNFLPYTFMFFPDMLPGPFKPATNRMGLQFNKWEMISRERSHAVIKTLLDLERDARVPPALANLNPFGRGKTKRRLERMQKFEETAAFILASKDASGKLGAKIALNIFRNEIYVPAASFSKKKQNLMHIPKIIIKGLATALDAPTAPSKFLPTFFIRGRILNNLKKIENADQFLVNQNIDLNSIRSDLLVEACNARLIGGPERSDEEMRTGLEQWLNMAVKEPATHVKETGLSYNGNFARTVLLSFNAIDAVRDNRAASYLPRLMFQGQKLPLDELFPHTRENTEEP